MQQVKLGKYKHFKGGLYEVIAIGKDCETLKDIVIYKALYEPEEFPMGQVWTRLLEDFVSQKDINGIKVARFKFIEPLK